jgi:Protein of unknown function (DUF1565)
LLEDRHAAVLCLRCGSAGTQVAVAPLVAPAAAGATSQDNPATEVPGPSAAVFANPFYDCARNYYVAPTGSDANLGSRSSPWATLQHARVGRVAGDCVHVAPGTYSAGLRVTRGGNNAASGGYVVYRCETLDGCRISGRRAGRVVRDAPGGNGVPAFTFNTEGCPY